MLEGSTRFEGEPVAWGLGPLDQKAFEETADVDAILALDPPGPLATDESWVEFGRSVRAIDTGSRYSATGNTSPLLAWYALIATQRPSALYRLHDEGVVTEAHLGHLIEMGLAGDWHEHIQDVDGLILTTPAALASLALALGVEPARRRLADAFFAGSDRRIRLDEASLGFALPVMSDAEIARIVPHIRSSAYDFDPRSAGRLLLDERVRERGGDVLALLDESDPSDRTLASYLIDGALLGGERYVSEMILDAADNAGVFTHWYCAACGLALSTEGLIGSALVEAVEHGAGLRVARERDAIAIETPASAGLAR